MDRSLYYCTPFQHDRYKTALYLIDTCKSVRDEKKATGRDIVVKLPFIMNAMSIYGDTTEYRELEGTNVDDHFIKRGVAERKLAIN